MDELPLLTFNPVFRSYVWGGRRLANWWTSAPSSGPLAEAWLLSDLPESPTTVASGPLAGATVHELIQRWGRRLIGVVGSSRFPLLLKFLDAQQPLSVQVHPDDQRAGPGNQGKTEAWIVLQAEPGSHVFAGFKTGVVEADVRDAITRDRLVDLLQRIDVGPGDCIFIPAGTVHAIGSGLLLFEIQQTSDLTYRLYDWGRPRPLQIPEALARINWSQGPIAPIRPAEGLLVDCDYFRLWRYRREQTFHVGVAGECRIIVVTAGSGTIVRGREEFSLHPGVIWFIPAEMGSVECRPKTPVEIIEVALPKR